MEGLANHMIVSGHHKKQVLRSHNYSELGLRHKHRKRFLSDDASGSTVASLLEYKRKYQGGGGGSNGYLPQVGCSAAAVAGAPAAAAASDGLITCEACGKRMEMQWFVEHVRLCLRQKAEVIDALKVKLSADDGGGGSGKAPESSSSSSSSSSARPDSRRLSPNASEQPLPSTKDSALFKRLNSLSGGASPGKEPDRASAARKDSDSAEEKSEETETDVNRSESQDVAKIQTQDGDIVIPCVKSADSDARSARSPETLSREADETRSAPKKDADSSPGETVQEKLPEKSDEPCAKGREQSAAPSGVAEGKEAEREKDASVPPQQIPSPMTDEDNTSEHERSPSPSPQSGLSQSGDSKPPSPSATSPPSSPPSKRTSPKILDSTKPSVKREHDSDGGGAADSDARNHKKMKLEESRLEHQEEAEDVEVVRKKIKVELPDDSDDDLKNRTPPAPATAASPSTAGEKSGQSGSKSTSSQLDKSLDIIDPNSGEEPAKESGSSALKAMESFIQRSFSSKFDSRRSSMSAGFGAFGNAAHLPPILGMSRVVPRSCASPPTSSSSSSASSAASSISYLSRFSKFFAPMQPSSSKYLDIAMDAPLPSFEKNVLSSLSARSAELLEKSRNSGRDYSGSKQVTSNGVAAKQVREAGNKSKPATTTTTSSKSADDDKSRESDDEKDDKKAGDKDSEAEKGCGEEEDERELANKYLNLDEEDEKEERAGDGEGEEGASAKPGTSSSSGKRSALDSLSSFVYGQPMTSEHPLDSLQKLLTKTSIPKMMTSAAGAFPHFNPHHYPYLTEQMMERLCCSPPDLPSSSSSAAAASAPAMPLNLSMKPGAGGSEDEDPGDCHPDCESPSTSRELEDGNHSSPGAPGPDGELTEYKCAACSRRFASKGSYRYHLSRCHLSSVKKYGIKEAFNMSPYIYLPLDHTAKFTKYYQMAQELASKGK